MCNETECPTVKGLLYKCTDYDGLESLALAINESMNGSYIFCFWDTMYQGHEIEMYRVVQNKLDTF